MQDRETARPTGEEGGRTAGEPERLVDEVRDRDAAGRARNARPRDAYGRPLPRGAAGEERVPDDYTAEPHEALAEAQRLLDADRPFHAHEVLEAAWKAAPEAERALWQGLAQLAVGFTHVRRGNARGAQALLRRGAARIAPYAGRGPAPHGIRAGELARHAIGLADRIERGGLDGVTEADLAPRLRG
jgi:hypothetical protein